MLCYTERNKNGGMPGNEANLFPLIKVKFANLNTLNRTQKSFRVVNLSGLVKENILNGRDCNFPLNNAQQNKLHCFVASYHGLFLIEETARAQKRKKLIVLGVQISSGLI